MLPIFLPSPLPAPHTLHCCNFPFSDHSVQIFVEFANKFECQKAQGALAGRKFASRVVVTSFFDVEKFAARDFTVV